MVTPKKRESLSDQVSFVLHYKLVLNHNFYIILSSNPGHFNPWINLIIALASYKILKSSV